LREHSTAINPSLALYRVTDLTNYAPLARRQNDDSSRAIKLRSSNSPLQ